MKVELAAAKRYLPESLQTLVLEEVLVSRCGA
jgi:hypothetical protein